MRGSIGLIAVAMLFTGRSLAQEESGATLLGEQEPGIVLGLTGGYAISDHTTANYYNGSGINNLETIIFLPYNYDRIKDQVVYDFVMGEHPTAMRYNGAAYLGGFIGYRTNNDMSFAFEMGITNLKLEDSFTILLDDPNTGITENDVEVCSITGEEKRVDFNLLGWYYFGEQNSRPYVEFGVNGNFSSYEENDIYIREWHATIVKAGNPAPVQSGFGYGLIAGGGVMFRFNDQNAFTLGFRAEYKGINIVEEDEKMQLGLHMLPYLRFIFG